MVCLWAVANRVGEIQQPESGLLGSVRRMLQTLSQLLGNRVELFLLELKEERLRLLDVLLLVLAGGICALMALALVTFAIVIALWDECRILVLISLAVAYAAGAVAVYVALRRRLRRWQAFSASLEQIKKDRAWLEARN